MEDEGFLSKLGVQIIEEGEIEEKVIDSLENKLKDERRNNKLDDGELQAMWDDEKKYPTVDGYVSEDYFKRLLARSNQDHKSLMNLLKTSAQKNERQLLFEKRKHESNSSNSSNKNEYLLKSQVSALEKLNIKKQIILSLRNTFTERIHEADNVIRAKFEEERNSSTAKQHTSMNITEVECPVCKKIFPTEEAEAHANACINAQIRKSRKRPRRNSLDMNSDATKPTNSDENVSKVVISNSSTQQVPDDYNQTNFILRMKRRISIEIWWKNKLLESEDDLTLPELRALSELEGDVEDYMDENIVNVDDAMRKLVEVISLEKLSENLLIPTSVNVKLYAHQKEGIKWLNSLQRLRCGGILGDEQGLGKTCQVAVFLGLLKLNKLLRANKKGFEPTKPMIKEEPSIEMPLKKKTKGNRTPVDPFKAKKPNLYSKSAQKSKNPKSSFRHSETRGNGRNHCYYLIVCPATTLSLWLNELHTWAPWLRVVVLHRSSFSEASTRKVISDVYHHGDVILTTYGTLRLEETTRFILSDTNRSWGIFDYIVLDEGHKLKNPLTEISEVVRSLRCVNRLVVTGTPLQNGLNELWTLFDIVKPGLLGTYQMFEKQFERIIRKGGSKTASKAMVYMAYKCAMILKQTVKPFMLRRMKKELMKKEVNASGNEMSLQLPNKTEHVLFCRLSPMQVKLYEDFLSTPELENFLLKSSKFHKSTKPASFRFLKPLQHICNHPQLFYKHQAEKELQKESNRRISSIVRASLKTPTFDLSSPTRLLKQCGKLQVLDVLLNKWSSDAKKKNKVLIFSQSRSMLSIMEKIATFRGFTYLRMDGMTSVKVRTQMIDRFNNDPEIFLFFLTTKVGGVGINLTGANKVIIYDPDWNPTTDSQARERAYRLGQRRDVKVLRFITSGTIEEKIYHRQIYKTYLANKVLNDPRQKGLNNLSKGSGIKDLFSLTGYSGTDADEPIFYSHEVSGQDDDMPQAKQLKESGLDNAFNNIVDYARVENLNSNDTEDIILRQEATRTANNAAKMLQKEQERYQRTIIEGEEVQPQFTGNASASLLSKIRARE